MQRLFRLLVFLLFWLPLWLNAQPSDDHATTVEVEQFLEAANAASSPTDAIESAKNALKIAQDLHFSSGMRRALCILGRKNMELGRSTEALRWLVEATNQCKSANQTAQLAEVYLLIGDVYFREKLFEKSLDFYQKATALRSDPSEIWEKIGDSFAGNRQPDSAKYYFSQLIFQFHQRNDLVGQIRVYQKLADAYNLFYNPKTDATTAKLDSTSQKMASAALSYLLQMHRLVELTGDLNAITVLNNNIACQYTRLRDYKSAVEYFRKVELQCHSIDCNRALLFTNLGIALHNAGQSKEGIDYLLRAQKSLADAGQTAEIPHLEHLIARTYLSTGDTYNALTHNELAMESATNQNLKSVLAQTFRTEAELYSMLFDFEKALEFFRKYLDLQDALRLEELKTQQRLEQQQFFLQTSEKEYQLLLEQQKVKDLAFDQLQFEKTKTELANQKLALKSKELEAEALALSQKNDRNEASLRAKELEALAVAAELRIAAQKLESDKKDRQLSDLKQQEEVQALRLKQAEAEQAAQQKDNERLVAEKDFQAQKQAQFQRFTFGISIALTAIALLLLLGFLFGRRANRTLARKNAEIEAKNVEIEHERHESDRLLHAILPVEIANELKATGAATPRLFDSVSILFTDFSNFTQLTERLSPEALLDELNTCFSAFDEIANAHGLEKIKTIGDSYMAAAGAPVENSSHPLAAVRAALEMQLYLKKRHAARPDALVFEMRIGIHTGQVVAGVVGKNKFAWDIWGDAVNTAARMEQSGEVGRVNISGTTFELVKGRFQCTRRGSIEAKHKGEIEMFFVEREVNS